MIKPKENELIYSVFARWQEFMGYNQKVTLSEIYVNQHQRPSVYFINKLNNKMMQEMLKIMPMEEWLEHTMFSVFSTFIPAEYRKMAYEQLLQQQTEKYRNILFLPKVAHKELKYCPLCAKEKGLYWNLKHQIPDIQICTEHNVYLESAENTTVLQQNMFEGFYMPSKYITNTSNARKCSNSKIISVANKMIEALEFKPIDTFSVASLIHSKLEDTKYKNSFMVQISELYKDMLDYYGDSCPSKSNIHSVIRNRQYNFVTVCYILDFLHISLNNEVLDEGGTSLCLTTKNRIYRQISSKFGVSERMVTDICTEFMKLYAPEEHFGGVNKFDYESIDKEKVKKCKEICENLYEQGERVTYRRLFSELNLSAENQIQKHLPLCRKVIEQYIESNEQYQVRRLENAIKHIKEQKLSVSRTELMKAAKLKREYIEKCYVSEYLSLESKLFIKDLFSL